MLLNRTGLNPLATSPSSLLPVSLPPFLIYSESTSASWKQNLVASQGIHSRRGPSHGVSTGKLQSQISESMHGGEALSLHCLGEHVGKTGPATPENPPGSEPREKGSFPYPRASTHVYECVHNNTEITTQGGIETTAGQGCVYVEVIDAPT